MYPLERRSALRARHRERAHLEVLGDRETREDVVELRDEVQAEARQPVGAHANDLFARKPHAPGARLDEAVHRL